MEDWQTKGKKPTLLRRSVWQQADQQSSSSEAGGSELLQEYGASATKFPLQVLFYFFLNEPSYWDEGKLGFHRVNVRYDEHFL